MASHASVHTCIHQVRARAKKKIHGIFVAVDTARISHTRIHGQKTNHHRVWSLRGREQTMYQHSHTHGHTHTHTHTYTHILDTLTPATSRKTHLAHIHTFTYTLQSTQAIVEKIARPSLECECPLPLPPEKGRLTRYGRERGGATHHTYPLHTHFWPSRLDGHAHQHVRTATDRPHTIRRKLPYTHGRPSTLSSAADVSVGMFVFVFGVVGD